MAGTRYRAMRLGDEGRAAALVGSVFRTHVAPLFSAAGVAEFLRYLETDAWRRRLEACPPAFVAEQGETMVGVVEGRGVGHISLLFVATERQRQGVGAELVRLVTDEFRRREPALGSLDVHASPNAVAAYERFGFRRCGPERVEQGIRFVLMEKPLT